MEPPLGIKPRPARYQRDALSLSYGGVMASGCSLPFVMSMALPRSYRPGSVIPVGDQSRRAADRRVLDKGAFLLGI